MFVCLWEDINFQLANVNQECQEQKQTCERIAPNTFRLFGILQHGDPAGQAGRLCCRSP